MRCCVVLILFVFLSCADSKQSWHMGIDDNENGIRDDIEQWITKKYEAQPQVKRAMLSLASIDPASCDFKYHTSCLKQVSSKAFIIQIELLEKLLDTDERRAAFEKRLQKCSRRDDRNLNLKCSFN